MEPSEAHAWISAYRCLFSVSRNIEQTLKENPNFSVIIPFGWSSLSWPRPPHRGWDIILDAGGLLWTWAQRAGGQEGRALQQRRKERKLKNVLLSWHLIFPKGFWSRAQGHPSSWWKRDQAHLWGEPWAALPGLSREVHGWKTGVEVQPWSEGGVLSMASYRLSRCLPTRGLWRRGKQKRGSGNSQ